MYSISYCALVSNLLGLLRVRQVSLEKMSEMFGVTSSCVSAVHSPYTFLSLRTE